MCRKSRQSDVAKVFGLPVIATKKEKRWIPASGQRNRKNVAMTFCACATRYIIAAGNDGEDAILMDVEVKPLVAGDATLDEVRAFFANDRYATVACGAVIEEARPGYARIGLQVGEDHLNGMGSLMGGVSFTMADFAFAVASNIGQAPTVPTNCNIDFLGAPKTGALVAECRVEKDGRTLCFARVDVSDSAGNPVARMNVTGFRKRR